MTMESMEYGIPVEEQMTQQPGGLPETAEPGLVPESPDHPPREDAEAGGTPEPGTNEGEVLEAAPKKKRAAKKKTEKVEGAAPEGGGALEASDGQAPLETPENGGAPPPLPETVPSDGELPEADRLDPEAGSAGSGDMVVVGLADQEGDDLPDGELPAGEEALLPGETALPPEQPSPPEEAPRTAAPRPRAGRPAEGHSPLLSLKLNELDRNLTEQERQEWNDIYASFRSKSVLTGRIIGVDAHAFHVHNRESGQVERKRMYCAAVISLRVKVLIPETEMWMPGEERPTHVLRNMSGAEIDYVILDVDRENNMAIASRRMGAMIRQRAFDTARGGHQPGERMTCRILTVGPSRCLVECGGRDLTLRYQDISYSSFSDLREKYHPGEKLDCVLKDFDRASGRLTISVKEAAPNPFEGAITRHPLGCRRQAVISGKYGGGVFCTMPDGTTCLCLYTAQHTDRDFHKGDTVILVIVKYDFERSLIYGRILSKW